MVNSRSHLWCVQERVGSGGTGGDLGSGSGMQEHHDAAHRSSTAVVRICLFKSIRADHMTTDSPPWLPAACSPVASVTAACRRLADAGRTCAERGWAGPAAARRDWLLWVSDRSGDA